MLTSTPKMWAQDPGDYFHGATTYINMDNGGMYTIRPMTTPSGHRYVSIHDHDASSCVGAITAFGGGDGGVFVHWGTDNSTSVIWEYRGIDSSEMLWRFISTLSLGGVANWIKATATETIAPREPVAV